MFTKKKKISAKDLKEISLISRIVFAERWKLNQLKGNTTRIKNGQEYVAQLEDAIKVLEEVRDTIVADILTASGFTQSKEHKINLETGEVSV